ncbi:MAG: hypothetical protein RQM90_06485 [Methanoculleus sp.]
MLPEIGRPLLLKFRWIPVNEAVKDVEVVGYCRYCLIGPLYLLVDCADLFSEVLGGTVARQRFKRLLGRPGGDIDISK